MTDININNYEAYLLDLAEGELSSADERLLMLFLDKHPDLKAEHELFEFEKVPPENIYFENKSYLKKTENLAEVSSNNFDELCISRIEGDLNSKEILEFDKLIEQNEKKEKEYKLFKLTQIVPNKNEKFQNKEQLKKREPKTFTLRKNYTVVSIAASIIILIGLYLFIPKEKENTILVSELDQNTKVEKLPEIIQEDKSIAEIKIKTINKRNTEINNSIPKQTHEVKETIFTPEEDLINREHDHIAFIDPIEIKYNFSNKEDIRDIIYVKFDEVQKKDKVIDKSITIRSYLAASFNKRVLKKEDKNKVELFDIAQIGLEKVNKLAGTRISLEKVYNENGEADRTKFNSRLLAFSTPIKKD